MLGRVRAASIAAVLLLASLPAGAGAHAIAAAPVALTTPAPVPIPLDYLQTIKFIDDGLRYVDPLSRFFISPAGELCFRVVPNSPQPLYESNYTDWCVHPQAVDRVEAAANDVTNINEVRLWCRHAAPQCAHTLPAPNVLDQRSWTANRISAATLAYREERAALAHLIRLMGGSLRVSDR